MMLIGGSLELPIPERLPSGAHLAVFSWQPRRSFRILPGAGTKWGIHTWNPLLRDKTDALYRLSYSSLRIKNQILILYQGNKVDKYLKL